MELVLVSLVVALIGGGVAWLFRVKDSPPPSTVIEPPDRPAAPVRLTSHPDTPTVGGVSPFGGLNLDPIPRRRAIQAAKRNGWSVDIVYCDEQGAVTERTIDPLFVNEENVKAHCHLRQDERRFRFDRMIQVRVHAAREDARQRYAVG